MNLQERKEILLRLGKYMLSTEDDWQWAKEKAAAENAWFIPEFVDLAATTIATQYLGAGNLQELIDRYRVSDENLAPQKVGIVMAGNVPMVGFHDLLCAFLTGHYAVIKLSSKDSVLLTALLKKMAEWDERTGAYLTTADMLKGCDAYIATGSNNSSTYFAYYFAKYPHIIRKNRTSVAILTGSEKNEELQKLADDVYRYFGLGCRNVTKIFVPEGYDFRPLLQAFGKYNYLADHAKYKNNYDYNLAVHLLNNRQYMSNESLLLVEDPSPFSPIAQLHYQFYRPGDELRQQLTVDDRIQCIVSGADVHFGNAQQPAVCDFADGVDTMKFFVNLSAKPEVRKS